MDIARLMGTLEQLQRLYEAGGAKTAHTNLARIITGLRPHRHVQIADFFRNLHSAAILAKRPEKSPTPPKKSPTPKLSGVALVEASLKQLADAGLDQAMFEQAFGALSKQAKKPEADQIARAFVHQDAPFKTKKDALAAIKEKFVERARFRNQLNAVGNRPR